MIYQYFIMGEFLAIYITITNNCRPAVSGQMYRNGVSMMTKISYSGLKYGKSDVEIKILVDIQNDWLEISHTKEVSQVMNKTTGEYIIVDRNTLKLEIV